MCRGLCQGRDMAQEVSVIVSDDDRVRLEASLESTTAAASTCSGRRHAAVGGPRGAGGVARRVGVSRPALWRWQSHFAEAGTRAASGRSRPGHPGRRCRGARVPRMVAMTFAAQAGAATFMEPPCRWPRRPASRSVEVQPDLGRARPPAAPDPRPSNAGTEAQRFPESFRTSSGCTLIHRAHGLVLSVDKKSRIQALDHAQPGLTLITGESRQLDIRLQAPRHHPHVGRTLTSSTAR